MDTAPADDGSSAQPESNDSAKPPEEMPAAVAATENAPPDDLPEWEPLTPELVEDEAIRGDFVMRWAVVGLAILLGCSQIAETKTLIHIRSGEYLASHGFLPPANDYFAFTRVDKPWVNLSWLFDLVAGGIHGLGGGAALSLFQAVVAAAIFSLLVHTVRPEIRTWWGSFCAAFALLACFRQFTIQPELITLLGVAVVLWWLVWTQEGAYFKSAWWIIPVIWLWSQLDPRAFWGWGLLIVYGLGELLGVALGRPQFASAERRRNYWIIAGASFLVAAVHPFTWHAWTSPWTVFGFAFPAERFSYPVPNRDELTAFPLITVLFKYWMYLNHEWVGGLYLACAALVTLLLNGPRTRISHTAIFVGANALPFLASHELAPASLVNCVIATLNAQEWYLARYGQTYSIQWNFLLFSRGGRAVTVLGLFAMAYLIISGRIDGAGGKRTGLGFGEQLQSLMTGYIDAFVDAEGKNDSFDDRPFPFVVKQGDLFIWAGQKSFVDSRLELFYDGNEDSVLAVHSKVRAALRQKTPDLPGSGERPVWRKVLDRYEITHVVPRMSGLTLIPNYRTFDDLSRSSDWKLTKLNSAAAVFYRMDVRQDRDLKAYIAAHQFDLSDSAFRDHGPPVTDVQVWPAATTAYQQVLSLTKPTVPGDISLAAHYVHCYTDMKLKFPQQIAALELAIRSSRTGLRKDPNSAAAYRTLGTAYALLDQLEQGILRSQGVALPHLLRYYQVASAYQSALLLDPSDPYLQQELAMFYLRVERGDLALRHLKEFVRLRPPPLPEMEQAAEEQLAQITKLIGQLEDRATALQSEIDQRLELKTPPLNVALFAYQNGAVLAAIQIMESHKPELVQSPQGQVLFAGWLMEAGRVEEADQTLRMLERQLPGVETLPGWRDNSVYSAWAQGDYARIAKLYEDAINTSESRRVAAALGTGPLTSTADLLLPGDRYPWMHVVAAQDIAALRPTEIGSQLFYLALCRLEQGDVSAAKAAFQRILDDAPTTLFRPLVLAYWYCLTDEILDLEPPSDWIPILFAEESE